MCGITAILTAGALDVLPGTIERMTRALTHRGPDAHACVSFPGCQLGHTRLSVIDLEGGSQPMSDASSRLTVVFNGEIYNFRELRAELERGGATFVTRSDTEVLLHAYQRFGRAMLSRLNGQFAFAIWDKVERTLFAARDRFGEKPLYWARSPAGHVLLASEIKSILASGLISPRVDRTSVDAYLGLFYVPPDRCIYENVRALRPGHAMTVRDGANESWEYWRPRYSANDISADEAVNEVRSLITRAVKRQTVADVPVGAFLSGGLDSSTIVALMSRDASSPVRTFSVGFGDLIDELPYARNVAQAYATEHHELQMDIDVPSLLQRMTEVYDEPFADSSNIPTYLVAGYAARDVKVVLSGDGGDEIFGGYAWYSSLLSQRDSATNADWWDRHLTSATAVGADRAALWGEAGEPVSALLVREIYRPGDDVCEMDRACFFDAQCYLPGDILVKVDRAAMAHGLETRAPFLDVDLVEFVLGLPWEIRFRDPALKHLLRAACGELWPASVRGRGKQGFGAPVRHWLELPGAKALWERVTRCDSALCALLPGVPRTTELRPQRRWTLLCLGLWLEAHPECLSNLA
jgi:asparagine synthase (glutamine-hydrolysing)